MRIFDRIEAPGTECSPQQIEDAITPFAPVLQVGSEHDGEKSAAASRGSQS